MTEKERILTNILNSVCSAFISNVPLHKIDELKAQNKVYLSMRNEVNIGDLVMCFTIRDVQFKFGTVINIFNEGHMTIKELGTNEICNIDNEMFVSIKNISNIYLLEGLQYKFYQKVLKVLSDNESYIYRFNGITFPDKNVAEVSIREAFNSDNHFEVKIKFNGKTTQKEIFEELKNRGYGTKFKNIKE